MSKLLGMIGLCVVVTSCGESQEGEAGALRFGLVYRYVDTQGFTAVAAGQPLAVAIQSSEKPSGVLNDYAYLDGTLTASGASGALTVERTGVGQFKTSFPTAGAYTLTAVAGGLQDQLAVTVVAQTGLRIAGNQRVVTTVTEQRSCDTALDADAAIPVLKKNQRLMATVQPVDATGAPLLALLSLTGSGTLKAEAISLVTGARANTFVFTPPSAGAHAVELTDAVTQQKVSVTVQVEDADATCPSP